MSDKPPEKPNLDLISMVQQARMMHDEAAKPSEVAAVYWIETKSDQPQTKPPTPRSGQWVLDVPENSVDALWEQVKAATQAGDLGYKSKVSTASRSQKRPNTRALVIRTYDSDDKADVQRIHDALLALGINGDWRYESDR